MNDEECHRLCLDIKLPKKHCTYFQSGDEVHETSTAKSDYDSTTHKHSNSLVDEEEELERLGVTNSQVWNIPGGRNMATLTMMSKDYIEV